ncbi:hypothetical protein [Noviherbaspirillum sp.]|uniref:hypothetical protein n=1 Tax=Noviherbaspirillum sp. TaxID=1926288 RepID=UPI002D568161|nr:hypothetical protein [Noviherbaspirillum sp.]HZW22480.1 hypothetical protein [Noviherbaspirillum sp.]
MPAIRCVLMLLCSLPLAACAGTEVTESKPQDKPAAQKKVPPRRAVPALVERPLPSTPPAPQVPMPSIPQPAQPAVPSVPAPVTACDPGGCWSGGARYEGGGAGGTYLNKGGRLCQSNGAWMQCF